MSMWSGRVYYTCDVCSNDKVETKYNVEFVDVTNIIHLSSSYVWLYIRKVDPKRGVIATNKNKVYVAEKAVVYPTEFLLHIDTLLSLAARGADLHANDDWLLCVAAELGQYDVVQFLLENGANVSARNDAPILSAARLKDLSLVDLLLRNGANIYAAEDVNGKTTPDAVMWYAIVNHSCDMIALLLKYGYDRKKMADNTKEALSLMGTQKEKVLLGVKG